MKKLIYLFLLIATYLHGFQGIPSQIPDAGSEVRIVPVKPTPESNTITLKMFFPRPYENKRKSPVNVQLRIEGFPLGTMTQNNRAKLIYNDPEGQAIHVIIDNEPYLIYNQSLEDSFDENREYYDKLLSFHIPFVLNPGQHVIRCFPARSYGESLKGEGCFSTEVFYFQDRKKADTMNVDLKKPYLTYNEPQGHYPLHKSDPILLDFYLSNCQLSTDGYKVRVRIDGEMVRVLTEWVPYFLYGMGSGSHTIKLELIDKENLVVPGFFNVVERKIEIE
ncbi:MAG: hypothetical protein K1060chlam2_00960 [Chlamydiae bacterium]|nr:hypothetical protein [Chlamydiota bacterium]